MAVRTGIPPQFLWQDDAMLAAIIQVLREQDKADKRGV